MPVESQRGIDERAALLPPDLLPFFDDRFVRSCDLIEEYVDRLTIRIARETGLSAALADRPGAPIDELVARAGLDAAVAPVPAAWIVATLAARGAGALSTDLDPGEIEREQAALDPRCLPSYRIAAIAAEQYPAVLRGEITGEQALFASDRMEAWGAYFSNDNPIYAISNAVASVAAATALGPRGGAVVELGGGFGSGAEALLTRLDAERRLDALTSYRFSEVSIPFLRRGQRALASRFAACPLVFARLDINRPFAEGGVVAGACALVYGVNVVHVARDLDFTLREIRDALAPGGTLVAGECVRPFADRPIHVELVFNLLEVFRRPVLVPGYRPNGGFLTPEQWIAALTANGFTDVRIVPDVASIREAYPTFVIAAITARRA